MKNFSNAWKVLLAVVLLGAGFWTGRAAQVSQSSAMPPLAGSGAGGRGAQASPPPKAVDGQGMYWSIDDLRKNYAAPASATAQAHLAWTPEYRLTIFKRPYVAPASAGAEMHEDKTQIYFIFSGTGTRCSEVNRPRTTSKPKASITRRDLWLAASPSA